MTDKHTRDKCSQAITYRRLFWWTQSISGNQLLLHFVPFSPKCCLLLGVCGKFFLVAYQVSSQVESINTTRPRATTRCQDHCSVAVLRTGFLCLTHLLLDPLQVLHDLFLLLKKRMRKRTRERESETPMMRKECTKERKRISQSTRERDNA